MFFPFTATLFVFSLPLQQVALFITDEISIITAAAGGRVVKSPGSMQEVSGSNSGDAESVWQWWNYL